MYKKYTNKLVVPEGYVRQILLIMRLTTIILIMAIMQVSAKTFAQRITLSENNATLSQVLDQISDQSGYDFVFTTSILKDAKLVTINVQAKDFNEVLKEIFKSQPLSYEVNKKTVVISLKDQPSFLDRLMERFKTIDVHGKILDENGVSLVGATIMIKGTNRSVKTGADGLFVISSVDEKAVLVISYIGYDTREVEVASDMGSLTLNLADAKLEEVTINAGYYSVTDRERTGNISKVTAATIEKQPVNNPLMALSGRVPGLAITQNTGVPGGGFTVRVRGQNTINSGNDPLYIIDGVNFPSTRISGGANAILGTGEANPLSFINPTDIESIEVLKDADATAIYGSRGANGVILITTKKGKSGGNQVNAGVSEGYNQVGHRLDLLNTDQYLEMRNEAFKNDGLQPGTTDYDVNGTWDVHKYTDWQKTLIGGKGKITNAFMDISGGNEKNTYLIAGNYYNEGTVFPGDFGFKRMGIRSNINLGNAKDRFNASFTINYNHVQSNLYDSDITRSILSAPNAPDLYNQYGQLNFDKNDQNPVALLLQTNDSGTDNLVGNLMLSYKILKNLILKTSLGYTRIKRDELHRYPLAAYSPAYNLGSDSRVSYFVNNFNNSFIAEPQLGYEATVGKGKISALVGMSLQDNNFQINTIRAANFNSDDLLGNLGSAGSLSVFTGDYSQYHYIAGFGRLNYSLEDKYFINITARRDGSSRYGTENQFANFGAIGASWIFTEEKNVKSILPFLSLGKLRASYGITGNDQIPNYGYLQLYGTGITYQGSSTLTPSSLAPNKDFSWETNRKLEGALELGFFNNGITLDVSYYKNRSSNLLLYQNLPLSTGLEYVERNLPGEVQNTGWEFQVNYEPIRSGSFQWSGGFNLTIPKNKLLSYPDLETSGLASIYQIGQPLTILKIYNSTVDAQTGLYSIEDKNGSGSIDDGDRYIPKFVGQYFYGGLQNSVSYKQFDLDFTFTFSKQNGRNFMSTALSPGLWLSGIPNNQTTSVLARWQQPGDLTSVQKFSTTFDNYFLNIDATSSGNAAVVDASYIKLKNVSFSYNFSKKWLNMLKIQKAAISIQGQNIFTLTKYIGLDPESQGLALPPLRTIMVGLNLTF